MQENMNNSTVKSDGDVLSKPKRSRAKAQKTNVGQDTTGSKQKGKGKGKVVSIYRGRNAGKLAKLLDMPVDIFCEISRYLSPLDLLQLARSSKNFNKILMSRSSRPIWRAARETYPDLPDCPPDLSEPEYARLVFMRECHSCLGKGVLKENYDSRSRLCLRCRHSSIARGDILLTVIPGLTKELLECVPSEYASDTRDSLRKGYFPGAAQKIVAQYVKAVPFGLPPLELEAAKAEFISQKKSHISQIGDHAVKLRRWTRNQMIAKQYSEHEAAERRKEAIHAKLLELGYSQEDIPNMPYTVEWNKLFEQPRDLTTRIWNNVRPKLERMLATYKVEQDNEKRERRKNARRKELSLYLDPVLRTIRQSDPSLYLPLQSGLRLPTCASIMAENDYQDAVTKEKLLNVQEQVLNEARHSIEEFEQSLLSSIISSQPKPKILVIPESLDRQFLLARTTYFSCKRCSSIGNYPSIQGHFCYPSTLRLDGNPDQFNFDVRRTTAAQILLASLPEDEKENMDEEKDVECDLCQRRMSWENLLRHFYPEGMKFFGDRFFDMCSNAHILEKCVERDQPLFTPNLDELPEEDNMDYEYYDDYLIPPSDDDDFYPFWY